MAALVNNTAGGEAAPAWLAQIASNISSLNASVAGLITSVAGLNASVAIIPQLSRDIATLKQQPILLAGGTLGPLSTCALAMSNEDALPISYKYEWSEKSDSTLQDFLTKVSSQGVNLNHYSLTFY